LLVMTIIGGTSNLFGSVLGAAFYLIVSDTLSAIWPRWLLLLGALLIVLALYVQKGIWGLIESAARTVRGGRGRPSAITAGPRGRGVGGGGGRPSAITADPAGSE